MDLLAEDPGLITEEQFDFTFGSPASDSLEQSSQEVEEEVFVGPVSHVERCVTRSLDLNTKEEVSRSTPGPPHWSPLTTEKFEEVCREANRIARQLEKATVKENLGKSPLVATLINGREPCRSPRRETYVVKDSPVRLLLPDISLDGVTNGDGGLASPSLHISSNAATPTTDRSTPTKQKATSKVCKTTPAVHKATHAATEPKLSVTESSPTARKGRSILDKTTPTAIKDTVFTGKVTPTTGKTAPGTKKATPTAGTPRRGTPSTATRNQVTPMRGSAKPNRSHSTKQAAGQAMPVSALHSQSMKSGLGIGGQSSIESSAGLQHEHGSHDGTGTGMQPFLIYGSPGDKRDFKVTQKADCSLSHRVAPTSQVSSMRGPAVCAKTKSKPLARSISATQASHTASTHLPKPSKGLRHQTTCTAIPRPVSQSAPQGKLMASGTGMSRLPVYRSLPVAQLCSSQSVSQGSKGASHCHSISQGDGIRHKKGAQMVFQ